MEQGEISPYPGLIETLLCFPVIGLCENYGEIIKMPSLSHWINTLTV
jgi:hypothetical protein